MLPDIRNVPIADIDRNDRSFRISTQSDPSVLLPSMEQFGLLHPPVLIQKEDTFRIINGFNRIEAAVILEWSEITGRILPFGTPHSICVQFAVLDNTAHRRLNLVEQGRCLALLNTIVETEERLIALANAMGLQLNPAMAAKLLLVNQMNAILQQGLIAESIALPVALRLHEIKNTTKIQALGKLLLKLNLSLNRQREIIDWVEAISRMEGVPITEVINDTGIEGLPDATQCDGRQEAAKIREYLKRRRYPSISQTEERYCSYLRQTKIPDEVRLIPPAHFEGETYTLSIAINSADDLNRVRLHIDNLANSEAFAELFKIG